MTAGLVIFDCDGVVVDSERITNAMLRDDLATRGLELKLEQIQTLFVGGTMSGVAQQARALGADLPEDWVDWTYTRIYDRLREATPLVPGIMPVLEQLHLSRRAFCIASNGRMAKMEITLGQHPEIWALLKGRLFSAEQVARPKPAPDLFLHAARAMGFSVKDCVVVEDSVPGATAATNAGMRCFGYAPEDDGARLGAVGAEVFHQMADLPALLSRAP